MVDLSPFLRQTVKAQDAAHRVKIPAKGGWSPGFVSTAVHEGIPAGRDPAAGDGGVGGRGGAYIALGGCVRSREAVHGKDRIIPQEIQPEA